MGALRKLSLILPVMTALHVGSGAASAVGVAGGMSTLPVIGLGTFQLKGDVAKQAVFEALQEGYRLVDTATIYRNEESVGEGLREAEKQLGIRRNEVFLTSKISPSEQGYEETLKASKDSLERLQTPYHDLLLVHWPGASKTPTESALNRDKRLGSWKALEELNEMGIAKRIGVSNFCESHVRDLLESCKIKPFLNQIEVHPLFYPESLINLCRSSGIKVQAYSSLGSPKGYPTLSTHPTVVAVSNRHGVDPATLLLAWGMRVSDGVLIRSVSPGHRRDALTAEDLAKRLGDAEVLELAGACGGGEQTKFCWDPSTVV